MEVEAIGLGGERGEPTETALFRRSQHVRIGNTVVFWDWRRNELRTAKVVASEDWSRGQFCHLA